MKTTENLRQLLKSINPQTVQTTTAKVKSINIDAGTATVWYDEKGLIADDDVQLQAITGAQTGFLIIPKPGSIVLVSCINNAPEQTYISSCSDIQAIIIRSSALNVNFDVAGGTATIQNQNTELSVTAAGYKINRGGDGLKKTLSDIIDAITQLTVTTGTGPSGVPINAAAFTQIKTNLNNWLE
jgi:hypothetical protein